MMLALGGGGCAIEVAEQAQASARVPSQRKLVVIRKNLQSPKGRMDQATGKRRKAAMDDISG
jgi:hypothetical protein